MDYVKNLSLLVNSIGVPKTNTGGNTIVKNVLVGQQEHINVGENCKVTMATVKVVEKSSRIK